MILYVCTFFGSSPSGKRHFALGYVFLTFRSNLGRSSNTSNSGACNFYEDSKGVNETAQRSVSSTTAAQLFNTGASYQVPCALLTFVH